MTRLLTKYPVAILFVTYVTVEVCVVTGIVCGPAFQRIFELSDTRLGLIFSALALGGLITSLGVGHVVHHLGLWRAWCIGMIGMVCAAAAVLAAAGFWTIFIPIFLLGITRIFVVNANNTFLSDYFSGRTLRAMALASGLWFGSSVITSLLIGYWVAWTNTQGMRWATYSLPYIISIILLVAVLAAAIKLLRPLMQTPDSATELQPKPQHNSARTERPTISQHLLINLIAYCHGSTLVPLIAWVNPMVQGKFAADDFHGALAFSALALGLATGRLSIAAGLINRDTRVMLASSGLAGGLLFGLSLCLPNYWATIAAVAVGGLLLSSTAPCMLALVSEKFFAVKSHVFGYMGASISAAAFVSPWLIGMLADAGVALDKALWLSPFSAVVLGLVSLAWKVSDTKGSDAAATQRTYFHQ
jgi:MFS family permease